jgi:hypothetical protein
MFKVLMKANKDYYVWELSTYSDIISLVGQCKSGVFEVYQSGSNPFEGEKNKDFWKYMMTISK